jgi:LPS sulfotransferase NodH
MEQTDTSTTRPSKLRRKLLDAAHHLFGHEHLLKRPVFVVGCGRSGTTILGEMLSHHPQLAYLNEPRRIWRLDPRTDVWADDARTNNARLTLTAADVTPELAGRLRSKFALEVKIQKGSRLVEKLPANSFRVAYIRAIFPDAIFVHLIRNAFDVAQSIQKMSQAGKWATEEHFRWELIVSEAKRHGESHLAESCTDSFLRGLLEWRVTVRAARQSLLALPPDQWTEVRYETLCAQPGEVCADLERFIGVPVDETMRRFAAEYIALPPAKKPTVTITPVVRQLVGDLMTELGYPL